MSQYRISNAARADIVDILRLSQTQFVLPSRVTAAPALSLKGSAGDAVEQTANSTPRLEPFPPRSEKTLVVTGRYFGRIA